MRVWVTGIGVVSPLARGAAATMDRLLAGDRAIRPLSLFALEGARASIAAEVLGLEPSGDAWSRTGAMAAIAAREAIEEAGVDPGRAPVDLVFGGTTGGMLETEASLAVLARDPADRAALGQVLAHPLSAIARQVGEALGPIRGARTLCSACSGGANAIILGAMWIRAGRSTCVVAGGADGLCRLTYAGFGALAALSPEPCRPFDRRRSGLNLGEGAAFLVLEAEEAARARGARPIAELRGYAIGAEAHHITNPESEGETASRVMSVALARAGIAPRDLDYVNAHGTATQLNDSMEAAALRRVLGAEAERVAVSSSKGQIGHTLGAAGAIEAAITAMAIARGAVPPTMGLEEVDPACHLAHVTRAEERRVRAAMSSSFGFGGTDTVLVLAEPHAFAAPPAAPRHAIAVTAAATVGPLGVLASAGSRGYAAGGAIAAEPRSSADCKPIALTEHLDAARARRLDRAGRLSTIAIATAQREAGLSLDGAQAELTGAILGSAYGAVDGSLAFLKRVAEKGAKLASPADFPNLVLSSPVAHASIYHGLRGPVLAGSDLEATAEGAIATAADMLAAGEAEAIFAGAVEAESPLIQRVREAEGARGPRGEGAAVVLLEGEDRARERGAKLLARLVWWGGTESLAEAPLPSPRAAVFCGRYGGTVRAALEISAWRGVEWRVVEEAWAGEHEAAGGLAAAAAIAAIAAGEVDAAMVIGARDGRGHAAVFVGDATSAQRARGW